MCLLSIEQFQLHRLLRREHVRVYALAFTVLYVTVLGTVPRHSHAHFAASGRYNHRENERPYRSSGCGVFGILSYAYTPGRERKLQLHICMRDRHVLRPAKDARIRTQACCVELCRTLVSRGRRRRAFGQFGLRVFVVPPDPPLYVLSRPNMRFAGPWDTACALRGGHVLDTYRTGGIQGGRD